MLRLFTVVFSKVFQYLTGLFVSHVLKGHLGQVFFQQRFAHWVLCFHFQGISDLVHDPFRGAPFGYTSKPGPTTFWSVTL